MKTTTRNYSQFYALLKQLPNVQDGNKEDFVYNYTNGRTTSLKEMKQQEYRQMVADIQASIASINAIHDDNPDVWRKRVIAVIGAYLRNLRKTENADIIKGIACRAAQYDDFNLIPVNRLQNIYNAFLNKNKDFAKIGEIVYEDIEIMTFLN